MPNGIFALNYFNAEGTKALTDYWEQMFVRDPELQMLMMANPGNYFEDSIELINSSSALIYNLQGQRLGTPQRGVNIVGGKKIIVK